MHEYIAELDGPQSYRTVTGKMILCKGGGGGGKGGAGALVAVVSMVVMPYAAPAIATALETSVAVGGAVAGAGMGAIGAAVTGGDPLKGALMGGVGGAIGGAMGGDAMMSNYVPGDFGATLSNNFNSLTGAFGGGSPAGLNTSGIGTDGLPVQGIQTGITTDSAFAPQAPVSVATGGMGDGFNLGGNNVTGQSMFGNVGGDLNTTQAGFNTALNTTTPGAGGIGNTSLGQLGGVTNTTDSVTGATASAPSTSSNGTSSGSNRTFMQALTDPSNLAKGATQLGLQTASSYLMGVPDALKAQQKTAEEQLALQREAYDFNKGQQLTKNTVGGQLIQDANSYNPNDFGVKAAANAAITDSNSWDAYQKSLEAQGRDPSYINAEKARHNTNAGLNQSTAYGTGWTAGLNAQTGTKTTGANLYQPISNPADMYSTAKQQGQSAVGYAGSLANTINQDFGVSPGASTAAKQLKDATGNATYNSTGN